MGFLLDIYGFYVFFGAAFFLNIAVKGGLVRL